MQSQTIVVVAFFRSLLLAIFCTTGIAFAAEPPVKRPNILLILADDLGYSDLGCYGGEIATPNLDRLAKEGLRFTQFTNTARCWPTRAALLTGYYPQQIRRDVVEGVKPSGAQGTRPAWAKLLPDLLQSQGYRSYHSGKWHIDGRPLANGFDRSYDIADQYRYFHPQVTFEDDKKLPPVAKEADYYVTDALGDHALKVLKDHAANHQEKPFFYFLAFTAPHFPLQARPEDIAKYRETYRAGWDKIRAERWKRLQASGIGRGKLSEVEREVGPPYAFPKMLEQMGPGEVNRPVPWEKLTAEQQEFQATKMAIHAAMVDRMDQQIGRVLEQIRKMNAWDDTLILFLSDNGASAEMMVRGEGHDPKAPPGSLATHLCLGPGWSNVANTPYRRHKSWVHAGGAATPLIAHWPKGIAAKGELRSTSGHAIDMVPTLLEVAGVKFTSPDDAPPMPGKSLLPALASDMIIPREALWYLHEGNRALRVGDWRLVSARNQPWELFNMADDPNETTNLSEKHPEKVKELAERWLKLRDEFFATAKKDLPKEAKGK